MSCVNAGTRYAIKYRRLSRYLDSNPSALDLCLVSSACRHGIINFVIANLKHDVINYVLLSQKHLKMFELLQQFIYPDLYKRFERKRNHGDL